MKLHALPGKTPLKNKRVLLRVDWNVQLKDTFEPEDLLKLERTIPTIQQLVQRGAVVIVMTHLGRPKGWDKKLSTEALGLIVHRMSDIPIHHLDFNPEEQKELEKAREVVHVAKAGTVFLLENLRFFKGEEKNDKKFAMNLASLGQMYVNDAFAACHRSHASIVGLPKFLPAFAGRTLVNEVKGLLPLVQKIKKPFLAFVGGAKLSTKMEVIDALLKTADKVYIGGAMANAFFKAKRLEIGKSFLEKEGVILARKLLKNKKIVLPMDVIVGASREGKKARSESVNKVKKSEFIGDIGVETMMEWVRDIRNAKTIVWNGPMGVAEVPAFSHGSLVLARAIASKSNGPAYGVVGGGDTLPAAIKSGMSEWVDHLSTGGGAILEFISLKGKLPGLKVLES